MSVFSLLLVLFIALKLIGIEPVAAWSWWWVMAPLWGFAVFWVLCFFSALAWQLLLKR